MFETTVSPPARALLERMVRWGIHVRREGAQLRLEGETSRLDAETLASLREHKAALLDLLADMDDTWTMPVTRPARTPAGVAQRKRWASGALVVHVADIVGDVDETAFRAAALAMLASHDALRTSLVDIDGETWQHVHAASPGAVSFVAWDGGLDLASIYDAMGDRVGDTDPPPCRVLHIRHADGAAIAIVARAHVADAESLRLLMAELTGRYDERDLATGDEAPVQYGDFAVAECRFRAHPRTGERIRSASDHLGLTPSPTSVPPSSVGSPTRVRETVTGECYADFVRVSAEEGVTAFSLHAALFSFALRCCDAESTHIVAIPFANRAAPPFRDVVGPLERMLPMRPSVTSGAAFAETARVWHKVLTQAHEHQDVLADHVATGGERHLPIRLDRPLRGGDTYAFSDLRAVDRPSWCLGTDAVATVKHAVNDDAVDVELVYDADRMSPSLAGEVLHAYAFALSHARVLMGCPLADVPIDPVARKAFLAARSRDPDLVLGRLRAIFAAVLDIPFVAPDGHFFELAGNSLLVAKVVSRIKREFRVAVSFSEVFRHPTPRGLAALVLGRDTAQESPLVHRDPLVELPVSPQQARYLASYNVELPLSSRMTVVQSLWDDGAVWEQAIAHLVARHELLHTGYVVKEGQWYQRIVPATHASIAYVEAGDRDEASLRAYLDGTVRSEAFDLREPPLMKVVAARTRDGKVATAVGLFNGILDAYSEGTFEAELREAYALGLANGLDRRPPLALQYQDFCRWQFDLAEGDALVRARRHWEERYPLTYPGFHLPAPDDAARRGEMRIFLLGEALTERARRAAAATESSLFGFLLANFFQLAAWIYEREDVSVGLLYHGRENDDLEQLVGYFVDLFCLRCDVASDTVFKSLVRQVNDELFQAVDHRVYQYQHLAARYGKAPSDPVFPITGFHVNNVIVPGREQQVPAGYEGHVAPLPYAPKFDFNIYVHESTRGILLRMAYATFVADAAASARIADRFRQIVEANTALVLEGRP